MLIYKLGYFAISLAGHDKGRIYMIVSEEGEMLGLCDGIRRPMGNPKYKKKKHVQIIRSERMAESFPEIKNSGDVDLKIRMAIRDLEKKRERNQEDI
jgi:hypothetical protein